jgi:hypothetical protein
VGGDIWDLLGPWSGMWFGFGFGFGFVSLFFGAVRRRCGRDEVLKKYFSRCVGVSKHL